MNNEELQKLKELTKNAQEGARNGWPFYPEALAKTMKPDVVRELIELAERAIQPVQEPDHEAEMAKVNRDVERMGVGFLVDGRRCGLDRITWFNRPGDTWLPPPPASAQDQVAAVRAVPEGEKWGRVADRLNELDKAIAYSTNLTASSKPRRLLYSILNEVCGEPAPSPQPELNGSIDSNKEFMSVLMNWDLAAPGEETQKTYTALIAYINQWKDAACALAREEGYAKKVSHVECGALAMLEIEMKRATDAEAKLAALPKKVRVPNNGYSALTKRWAEGWNDCIDAINTVPPHSDTSGLPG